MDAFANALALPDVMDVADVGPVPLTPSQDIATPEQLEEDDRFETEAWNAYTNGDLHSQDDADNSTVHRPACIASKKRLPVGPTSSKKKPRYNQSSTMKVHSLVGIDTIHVPSVFVDGHHIKKGVIVRVPIPLWNQYTVTWGAFDFGEETRWIVIGTQEMWMKRLVDMVQKKPVRHWAPLFLRRFAREFEESLLKARAPEVAMTDIFSQSRDESPDSPEPLLTAATKTQRLRTDREESRVIRIKIGEFTLTCVNTSCRCLMKLDSATKRFIASWVAPLIKEMTPNMPMGEWGEIAEAPVSLQRGSSSESLGAAVTFRMPENATPNHREKVCWDPPRHTWKISVKKPVEIPSGVAASEAKSSKKPIENFAVSPRLDGAQYEAEKVAKYWRAIQAWNDTDKSKRHRIPTTTRPEALSIE